MDEQCPFCHECTLSWEDFSNYQGDCAGSRVCTSCGGVVDESNLTASDYGIRSSEQHSSADGFQKATARERQQFNVRCGAPSISKGRRKGLILTKRISQHMDCKPTMTAEAADLFERFVDHPNFLSCRLVAKEALAACSVYITCRRHNWPVTLADVCSLVDTSIYVVDSWKKRINATFPELASIRAPDVFELLELRSKKAAIDNKVQEMAVAIIKLCRDLWVCQGCKADNIIIPSLFIAWQSEDPVCRLKAKMRDFCREHQLQFVCTMTFWLNNMRKTLCRLADGIPWLTASSVKDTSIPLHVHDIVRYRSTLIAEARADIMRMQRTDGEEDGVQTGHDNGLNESSETSQEVSSVSGDNAHSEITEAVNSSETNANSGNFVSNNVQNVSAVVSAGIHESSNQTVKRQHKDDYGSFWPPLGYRPFKRYRKEESEQVVNHPDLNSADLSTYDIPDEDMHLYMKYPV